MNKERLKGNSELLILAVLERGPMHGYALSQMLQNSMPGMFSFGVGMLYPLLHKMEKKKRIKGEWKDTAGAKRRLYSLTERGKKELAKEKKEWQRFSGALSTLLHPMQ